MICAASMLILFMSGPPDDVPDSIIYAIAMRESGYDWSPGMLRHIVRVSSTGDVSPWQISPAVIRDLKANKARARTDARYAESLARRWLAHLFQVTRSWRQALAAYHAGLQARQTPRAQAYADQCLNLAALYH